MHILQALEQMQAFLRDFAPTLMSYKQHLMKQGFTEDEAFTLVRDYQKTVLKNGKEE